MTAISRRPSKPKAASDGCWPNSSACWLNAAKRRARAANPKSAAAFAAVYSISAAAFSALDRSSAMSRAATGTPRPKRSPGSCS